MKQRSCQIIFVKCLNNFKLKIEKLRNKKKIKRKERKILKI